MAKTGTGILGPISGKLGNVVAATWKGIPYIRIKPLYSKHRKPTPNQKIAREKFKVAQLWLKPILYFLREGFKGYTPTVEGFIAAKSHLMKNAMELKDGKYFIDPSKVLVSYGDLPLPADIGIERVKKDGGDELVFTWDPKSHRAYSMDQCMLLAYDVEKGVDIFTLLGEFRHKGKDTLSLYKGKDKYHVYIAFVSADRSRRSESVYLGMV